MKLWQAAKEIWKDCSPEIMGRARSFHVTTTWVAERQAEVNTAVADVILIRRVFQRIVALTKSTNIDARRGQGVSTMATDTIMCPKCGTANQGTAMNCSHCRINLAWALENVAPDELQPEDKTDDDETGVGEPEFYTFDRSEYFKAVEFTHKDYQVSVLEHPLLRQFLGGYATRDPILAIIVIEKEGATERVFSARYDRHESKPYFLNVHHGQRPEPFFVKGYPGTWWYSIPTSRSDKPWSPAELTQLIKKQLDLPQAKDNVETYLAIYKAATQGNTKLVSDFGEAEQGNVSAQRQLGLRYARGEGVARDQAEAAKWFMKAAEQGDADAQVYVGDLYRNGQVVPQDYAEAVRWYRKAADQGNAVGQCQIGRMFATGRGVTQDYAEAIGWYCRAGDQEFAPAQSNLADMYASGHGVPKDDSEAARWYRKAAELGDAEGQARLGMTYYFGRGVSEDETEAVKWFTKAADQGHAYAQFALGLCYANGEGIPKDDSQAVKWLLKAAEQGNKEAEEQLQKMGHLPPPPAGIVIDSPD